MVEFPVTVPVRFTFGPKQDIRVLVDEQGEVWFFPGDVCAVLGLTDVEQALSEACQGAGIIKQRDPDGRRALTGELLINEHTLQRLMSISSQPNIKRFQSWVASELLPTLRRGSGPLVPPNTQDTLSKAQYTQLVRKVESIARRFWFEESARRALYDRLRAIFNVTRVDHIHPSDFEQALWVLAEIEPNVHRYVNNRCTDESRFIETVLRGLPHRHPACRKIRRSHNE